MGSPFILIMAVIYDVAQKKIISLFFSLIVNILEKKTTIWETDGKSMQKS